MATPNKQFENYFNSYITSNNKNEEFEVRFGTKGAKLTKNDVDNVVKKLFSENFESYGSELYTLKIQTDLKDKNNKFTNIRVEIQGLHHIQNYCKTNQIGNSEIPIFSHVIFTKKSQKKSGENILRPINFLDYNFRVSYVEEKQIGLENANVKEMVEQWSNLKKTFRLVKRSSFVHNDYPFRVDCSIVKSSKVRKDGSMIYNYNYLDATLDKSPEIYEIEIEAIHDKIDKSSKLSDLKKIIKIVLAGVQQTNFPIKTNEINEVLREYYDMIYKSSSRGMPEKLNKYSGRNFIGPASISLELENVRIHEESSNVPSILTGDYVVTDKADGMRKLMLINSKGVVYLIDTNMKVQFTGAIVENKKYFNTIIDGEHILLSKTGEYINLYAAFDLYILKDSEIRNISFINKSNSLMSRYMKLRIMLEEIKFTSIQGGASPINVRLKDFYDHSNIFNSCKEIFKKEDSGYYEYETDGLIFTPANGGVNIKEGAQPKNTKTTWMESFKWKPPEYNTIDFLATTKKEKGIEVISNIFESGTSTTQVEELTQYKTLELRVGYDVNKHGFNNPCQVIIDDDYNNVPSFSEDTYKPALFHPTNPSAPDAHVANIVLKPGTLGKRVMLVEDESDVIEDNTIIECRYDKERKEGFKWIPIRVRHDKTHEYKRGFKNYGNAYHVADSVWKTIHNPITREMLETGENIPDIISDDNIYYNRSGEKSVTQPLRNFHNLYIKKKLITGVANRGDTLIDTSVGKAGDMSKWISAHLSFVFGLDVSRDNIYNKLDGACARYIKAKQKNKDIFDALFVQSNSGLNIQNGAACFSEKCKNITDAVFGKGPKDKNKLGAGVYKNYGKGKDGFNIVSSQFALHYFFENKEVLHSFLKNVSECCKVGGYFIGTCYDGKKLFNELRYNDPGEGISEFQYGNKSKKIWQVIKQYDEEEFKDDDTSLGYAVDVYQETINKVFREYLVNFTYLTYLMEQYGFRKLNETEIKDFDLPGNDSICSFENYFKQMEEEIKRNPTKEKNYKQALNMSPEEKRISYLNNAFVFKKIRNVNAEQIKKIMEKRVEEEIKEQDKQVSDLEKEIQKEYQYEETTSPVLEEKPKKIKKKLKIKLNKK